MVACEAFANAVASADVAVTPQNVYDAEPGQLTKAIVGFFSSLLDNIRGLLGLWSMDELIFNAGWRGTGYIGGAFPKAWEPHVWGLFGVMEIFAVLIVLVGVLNTIYKNVLGAINPTQKAKAMEKVQDIAMAGVALIILPIALNLVLGMSSNITSIIYEVLVPNANNGEKRTVAQSVSRFASSSGSLVGVIGQFMFFSIQVSFNFMYALRALTIAVLIIIAPIMIAMMIVSDSKKQSTMSWLKELLAQICVQPIHAFCLSVILLLPASSHAFDNILALYALIPFSSLIKSFFFGSAGSWSDQLADRAKNKVTGTLAGAAIGGASAVTGAVAGKVSEKLDGKKGGDVPDGNATKQGNANNGSGANSATTMADAVPQNGGNAGADGGSSSDGANVPAGSGGAGGGTGGAGGAGASGGKGAPISTASPALGKNAAAGNATPKNNSSPSTARRVGRVIGGAAITAGSVAGGIALATASGALSGAGVKGDFNKHMAVVGEKLLTRGSSYGANKVKSGFEKSPQQGGAEMPAADVMAENGYAAGITGGTEGAADFSTYDDDKAVSTEWNQEELAAEGISNVREDKDSVTMRVAADSQLGQSLGQIEAQTSKMSTKEQVQFAKETGVSVTRNRDGSLGVNINKQRFSAANDGAKISYDKQNGGTLRMTNKESNGIPGGLISNKAVTAGVVVGAAIGAHAAAQSDGTTEWTLPANNLNTMQRHTLNNTDGVTQVKDDNGNVTAYKMTTAGSKPPVINPTASGKPEYVDRNLQPEVDAPELDSAAPEAVALKGGTIMSNVDSAADEGVYTKIEWNGEQLADRGISNVSADDDNVYMTVAKDSDLGREMAPTVAHFEKMSPDLKDKFTEESGVRVQDAGDAYRVTINKGAYQSATGATINADKSVVDGSSALVMEANGYSAPSGELFSANTLERRVDVSNPSNIAGTTIEPMANGNQRVTIPASSLGAFQEQTLASNPNVKPIRSRTESGRVRVTAYQYETNGTPSADSAISPPPSPPPSAPTGGGPTVSNGAARTGGSYKPPESSGYNGSNGGRERPRSSVPVDTTIGSDSPVDSGDFGGTDGGYADVGGLSGTTVPNRAADPAPASNPEAPPEKPAPTPATGTEVPAEVVEVETVVVPVDQPTAQKAVDSVPATGNETPPQKVVQGGKTKEDLSGNIDLNNPYNGGADVGPGLQGTEPTGQLNDIGPGNFQQRQAAQGPQPPQNSRDPSDLNPRPKDPGAQRNKDNPGSKNGKNSGGHRGGKKGKGKN